MADPCTKFEVSSVSRWGDITWGVKFYKRSPDPDHALFREDFSPSIAYFSFELLYSSNWTQKILHMSIIVLSHFLHLVVPPLPIFPCLFFRLNYRCWILPLPFLPDINSVLPFFLPSEFFGCLIFRLPLFPLPFFQLFLLPLPFLPWIKASTSIERETHAVRPKFVCKQLTVLH